MEECDDSDKDKLEERQLAKGRSVIKMCKKNKEAWRARMCNSLLFTPQNDSLLWGTAPRNTEPQVKSPLKNLGVIYGTPLE